MSTPNQPMSQLWPLTVTTPAGVQPGNPQITPWPLTDANLEYIDIIIPDGPSGELGVAVYWSGTQIIPWGTNSWLITNDEKIHIPVDSYITVSGLEVYTYNQGIFDHAIYLRALVKYTTTPVVQEQGTIGATIQQAPEGAEFDESLTPAGLSGNLDESGEAEIESSGDSVSGDLAELPESIV